MEERKSMNSLMRRTKLLLMGTLVALAASGLPATAAAQTGTVNGTPLNDQTCVYFDTFLGYNVACVNSVAVPDAFGNPERITTPLTIDGLGGDDEITVYEFGSATGQCDCRPCTFGPPADFAYGGGTVTIFGSFGDDEIAGGAGDDVISGEFGDDVLSGSGSADELHGGDGQDDVTDHGGDTNDELRGQGADDCMGDCTVAFPGVCEGGPGVDGSISCAMCVVETSGDNCIQSCPEP